MKLLWGTVLGIFGALAAILVLAAPAFAASEHLLDPTLSLTGGTGTSSTDPVPDPGSIHPAKIFNDPCGVTTDVFGDIYVANGASSSSGAEGLIDVFSSQGEFITSIANANAPCNLAVDSKGRLYVTVHINGESVIRYEPTIYEPDGGKISYENPPAIFAEDNQENIHGVTVNPADDHIFITENSHITELEADGTVVRAFGEGEMFRATDVAVWGENGDVAVTAESAGAASSSAVFVFDGTTHKVKATLDGSACPDGAFGFSFGRAGIAIDQEDGDIYVADVPTHHVVDQFQAPEDVAAGQEPPENCLGQLKIGANGLKPSEEFNDVTVDNREHSPNTGYVYVTSGNQPSNSHLYAFAPLVRQPPTVQGEHAEEITDVEAVLAGEVDPHGVATSYYFEYGSGDCTSSSCQKLPVPPADAGASNAMAPVSVPISGLVPGATYHFRLTAVSHCNPADPAEECVAQTPDATFSTYPSVVESVCPNSGFRVGLSARLPDCRAYELVTPAETGGLVPTGAGLAESGNSPPFLLAAADGESVLFSTEGGALSAIGGGGYLDAYLSTRGPEGWHTNFTGLDGAQAQELYDSGESPDHSYSLWTVLGTKGTLASEAGTTAGEISYLRAPDGTTELIGVGASGTDPRAEGRWLSAEARHLIFIATKTLDAKSPPVGVEGIYDRTPGSPARVISLLPGDVPIGNNEAVEYQGASADGSSVAFKAGIGGITFKSSAKMYVRLDNLETKEAAPGGSTFAGLSADGRDLFYLLSGDVFRFDSAAETTQSIGTGGKSTVVNVSPDGSHVYFVSPVRLTGSQVNSAGAKAVNGGENLYVWDAATEAVRFIATVTELDVIGEPPPFGGGIAEQLIGGLGLWTSDVTAPRTTRNVGPANDPSRTDTTGNTFVFESRASLTGHETNGQTEIYRYDAGNGVLACVSCNPTGAPAVSPARLESRYASRLHSIPPVNALSQIENIAAGGRRVFFESGDALSFEDTDETTDVYEWEEEGLGGCELPAGCIQLISSGHSAVPNYLYGVGRDGRDVFFWSGDQLNQEDSSATPSIYDAREGGGFPVVPTPVPCTGEGCQGRLAAPPLLSVPGSASFAGKAQSHGGHRKRSGCHRRKHGSHHGSSHRCRHRSNKARSAR